MTGKLEGSTSSYYQFVHYQFEHYLDSLDDFYIVFVFTLSSSIRFLFIFGWRPKIVIYVLCVCSNYQHWSIKHIKMLTQKVLQ